MIQFLERDPQFLPAPGQWHYTSPPPAPPPAAPVEVGLLYQQFRQIASPGFVPAYGATHFQMPPVPDPGGAAEGGGGGAVLMRAFGRGMGARGLKR